MGQGVRAVMARLANELGERATLRTEQLGAGDERVELVPRNPAAATVAIEHSPDADDEDEEVWVTVADEAAPEEPGDSGIKPRNRSWAVECRTSPAATSISTRYRPLPSTTLTRPGDTARNAISSHLSPVGRKRVGGAAGQQ
jgi:hypothetical protein